MKDLKAKYNILAKKIQCDYASENDESDNLYKKEGKSIAFENIAPGRPQKNGHAEQKFSMLLC